MEGVRPLVFVMLPECGLQILRGSSSSLLCGGSPSLPNSDHEICFFVYPISFLPMLVANLLPRLPSYLMMNQTV